jgi:hypothetical protein
MPEAPTAYPLQWPAGKPRSKYRSQSGFHTWDRKPLEGGGETKSRRAITAGVALGRLRAELERLGARSVVISTNVELRLDGLPRANRNAVGDAGVAVYFQLKSKPIVLACDTYWSVAENMAAIAAHIAAMRVAERHGVGSLEEMFAGFMALPPGIAPDDWRGVLGAAVTLEQAEAVYREKIKEAHPDVGGTEAEAAKLNAAISLARKHFNEKGAK